MELLPLTLGLAGGSALPVLLSRLREHRVHPAGLADLLPWAYLVADGVILQKDGALLTGWRYRGPDLASATSADLDLLAAHVNAALLPLGDGYMLHFTADRRPAAGYPPPGAFPDPVTALIDEERRQAHEADGQHFETDGYCTLTYLPPPDLWTRLARHFVTGASPAGEPAEDGLSPEALRWSLVLGEFERQAADFERRLASRLAIERLGSDALLTHLHVALTGLHHPVAVPRGGACLDFVLADQDFVGGWRPVVGGLHLRVIAIHGYPAASHAGLLGFLDALPHAARVSHRLIPLGQRTAARQIRRLRQGWFRKRKGLFELITAGLSPDSATSARQEEIDQLFEDQDALAMARDAQQAEAANSSGTVRFAHYTLALVLTEPTAERADRHAAKTLQLLQDRGFTARVETVNAVEAFLGTLPGIGYANLRRHLLHTANLADLLPLTSVWPGLSSVPSSYFPEGSPPLLSAATSGSTPFRLNLHVSDVGHTLVIGPTGSGKSTFVNLAVAQFLRYEGAQVFVFDVGCSGYLLAQAAGAKHYPIATGAPDALTFQPLARIDRPGELAWAAQWLELALTLQGVAVQSADRLALNDALRLLAEDAPDNRTLTGLLIQLQAPHLVQALTPYTLSGPYGELLDSTRDHLEEAPYLVFEIQQLLDSDPWICLPVLTYLFHRIEARLDGRPTLIVLEEAWLPLLHSAFADRVKAWLLTLRKRNAAVVLVTQSLGQLQATPAAAIFFDSCPTRILLPNAAAPHPGNAELYAALGLNSTELRILAEAVPKRQYYYQSPLGRRLFELGLGPFALAWLGAAEGMTLPDTLRAADALRAAHGPRWTAAWLRQRGLDAWADRLDALQGGS